MTTANKITIFRMFLIPVFVGAILCYVRTADESYRLAAFLAFSAASILDGVDGYIARHYNQMTELGTVLDPLADKLLLVSGVVVLSFDHGALLGQFPMWLGITIIGRDIIILMGMVFIRRAAGRVTTRPHIVGKIATVLQMVCVIWLLLKWDQAFDARWIFWLVLTATLLTAVSGALYILDGVNQMRTYWNRDKSRNPGVHPQ